MHKSKDHVCMFQVCIWSIGSHILFNGESKNDYVFDIPIEEMAQTASLAWQYGTSHGNLTQVAGYPGFWISSIRGGRNACMRSRLAGQVAQSHETKCRDSAIHGSKDEEQGKRC